MQGLMHEYYINTGYKKALDQIGCNSSYLLIWHGVDNPFIWRVCGIAPAHVARYGRHGKIHIMSIFPSYAHFHRENSKNPE